MGNLRSNVDFVRLFLGRLVTNAGDSIYGIAAIWLVHELTASPFFTGLAGFLSYGPQALQFMVGPLVDRWDLRKVLVGSQLAQAGGVLIVPIVAATGHLSVWVVLLVMPVLTFLNQFVYPAQNATIPRIVDEEQLVQANSLISFAYQGVGIVFNAASGVLVALTGAVFLYVIDSVTFVIAVVLFVGLSIPKSAASGDDPVDDSDEAGYVSKFYEGINYMRGSALIAMLIGSAISNFAYGVMIAVLPSFAASFSGAEAFGILTSAMASGTLIGAILASRIEDHPFGYLQIIGALAAAACWFMALTVPGLPVTTAFFCLAFIPSGALNVLSSSMMQSAVDDTLLGRVMSTRSSLSTAMLPAGSLLGGIVAGTNDARTVMFGLAITWFFLAGYFFLRPRLRNLPSVHDVDERVLELGTRQEAKE